MRSYHIRHWRSEGSQRYQRRVIDSVLTPLLTLTRTQPPCNTGQGRAQKTSYLCKFRKPVQRPATPDRSLVMSRSAVRVRSSALDFSQDLQGKSERKGEAQRERPCVKRRLNERAVRFFAHQGTYLAMQLMVCPDYSEESTIPWCQSRGWPNYFRTGPDTRARCCSSRCVSRASTRMARGQEPWESSRKT
jgi:hypothetical protein